MAFRTDEAIRDGKEDAKRYLISKLHGLSNDELSASHDFLSKLFEDLGPVVDSYPTWHPLVNRGKNSNAFTVPDRDCGFKGLDHTVYFANGFITCPYDDGQKVIDSVDALVTDDIADITAERLNVKFYNANATPILVKCIWTCDLASDGTIPLKVALPLLLEKELPHWRNSEVAETWDSMRPYFLGNPCGKRSSLFVNQETGQAMKKIWETLINTGMYGPIFIR